MHDLVDLLQHLAVIHGAPNGIVVMEQGYVVLRLAEQGWMPENMEHLLRSRSLPEGFHFALSLDGKTRPLATIQPVELYPQIIFYPSGHVEPFQLTVQALVSGYSRKLTVEASGTTRIIDSRVGNAGA